MKKRTILLFHLIIATFTFSLCTDFVVSQANFERWISSKDAYPLGLWTDDTYVYSISQSISDNYFLKWSLDGSLLQNTSLWKLDHLNRSYTLWGLIGYDEFLYTCGMINSVNYSTKRDGWIAKWDKNWTQIWNQSWITDDTDELWGIRTDGNALYTTGTYSNSSDPYWLLVKWDMDGNQIWNKTRVGALMTPIYHECGFKIRMCTQQLEFFYPKRTRANGYF